MRASRRKTLVGIRLCRSAKLRLDDHSVVIKVKKNVGLPARRAEHTALLPFGMQAFVTESTKK